MTVRSMGSIINRIVGSRTLRTAVSVLFILNTILMAFFAMSFSYLEGNHFYTSNGKRLRDEVTAKLMDNSRRDALEYYNSVLADKLDEESNGETDPIHEKMLKEYAVEFEEKNCNYCFAIIQDGTTVYSNYVVPNYIRLIENDMVDHSREQAIKINGENIKRYDSYAEFSFEGYLKKEEFFGGAKDKYWYAARFFSLANKSKYAVFALMVLFAALEILLASVVYSVSGVSDSTRKRDLDQIPMYFLAPFCALLFWLCILFLQRQTASLSDLSLVFTGLAMKRLGFMRDPAVDIEQTAYIVFLLLLVFATLLQMLLSTVSVRLHRPTWWHRSILYRTFAGRTFGQRARTILSIAVVLQFAVYFALSLTKEGIPWEMYFLMDGMFVVTMTVILYIVYKDMSVYIPQTRQIVSGQIGSIPTERLSDSGRKHAENINVLSRNANSETEKRYINESFSTELIHSVSEGLRDPLKEVSENIRLLESGTQTEEQSRQSIAHIVTLSQDLKKTIEDLILISKASTGNLPIEPVPTDAGMMLSQAIGEFYPRFEEAGVEPVTEQPDEPVMIRADGQYMWYVFEGILSVMLDNAVAGTRLFMRAGREGENVVIVFRCTVRADANRQLHELSGMGMSSAKVFAILQGGSMVDHLSQDTLIAVLRFPAILPDASE